jgi:hypothetical protein
MRKYRAFLAGLVVLIAAIPLIALFVFPSSRISRDSQKMIKLGMSRAEVERILDSKPGDFRTRECHPAWRGNGAKMDLADTWIGNQGAIYVWYSDDDVVYHSHFAPCLPVEKTLIEKATDWVGSFKTITGRRGAP